MTTRRRLDPRDDRGVTMVELVVAMTIMAIVMVLSTGAITLAFGAGQQVDSSTSAQTQASLAYDRLDKVVRWVSGISAVGTVGGDPDVELLSTYTGTPTCTQLRLDSIRGELRIRSWSVSGAAPVVTDWTAVTSGVVAVSATGAGGLGTSSFAVLAPDPDHVYQRLAISLVVSSGTNANRGTSSSVITFDAANTTVASTAMSTCASGRSNP